MPRSAPSDSRDPTPTTRLRVGTSGFGYREWIGKFYPPGLSPREMLPFYAGHFSSVEINSTFYRMPSRSVLESWASQVPEDFLFAFKAPARITHRKRLRGAGEETAAFAERISVLGPRLGPVLFLVPPSLPCSLPLLRQFVEVLPGIRAAFEFRHPSWFSDDVFALLREHGCALCISNRDEAAAPQFVATAGFGYVRLRRSEYTGEELKRWRKSLEAEWEEVFVYFRHEETAAGPTFARRMLEGDR